MLRSTKTLWNRLFARKPSAAKSAPARRRAFLESLEERRVMAGSLDPTFGNGGIVLTDIGHDTDLSDDFSYAVTVQQADGKTIAAGYSYSPFTSGSTLARYNVDGSLDSSFGNLGRLVLPVNLSTIEDIELQSDGKIVIGGGDQVARLNSDGSLDTSFDTDGIATLPIFSINEIVIQNTGKIVLGGRAYDYSDSTGYDFALARLDIDGSLDTTFGAGAGYVTTDMGTTESSDDYDYLQGLALAPGDKLVAVGRGYDYDGSSYTYFWAVAQYDADGALDPAFSGDGKAEVLSDGSATSVVVTPSGAIAIAGYNYSSDFEVVQLTSAGALDPSFDSDGRVSIDFSGSDDRANTIRAQADGKLVLGGHAYSGAGYDFAVARLNANGSLDTSFSSDGKVTIDFGSTEDVGLALALSATDEITISGYTSLDVNTSYQRDFAVARLTVAGALDTSFDGDGLVTTNFGDLLNINTEDYAWAVTVQQADGKVIVAGRSYDGYVYGDRTAVARLNVDGSLDTTFATSGLLLLNSGEVRGVQLQADGKILLLTSNSQLIRLNANGSLDGTFGSGGFVSLSYAGSARDFVQQSDGKIVIGGRRYNSATHYDFALERRNPDGSLDTSFGGGAGYITTEMGITANANDYDYLQGLAVDSSDRLIAVGYGRDYDGSSNTYFGAAARYLPDGTLDTSFSSDGKAELFSSTSSSSDLRDVVVASTGEITIAANTGFDSFAVVRLTDAGLLDTGFDTDGIAVAAFDGYSGSIFALALQADGKVVASGYAYEVATNSIDFAVARFNPDGALDPSFSGDGTLTTDFSAQGDYAYGVAIAPTGEIVVAGHAYTNVSSGYGNNFGIARYTAAGLLDTTFDVDGKVLINFGLEAGGYTSDDQARSVAVQQADGKLIAVGYSYSPYFGGSTGIARYNTDGSLDSSFGTDGTLQLGYDDARAVAVQPDGKILLLTGYRLLRLNGDGSLDTSFGSGGVVVTNSYLAYSQGLVIQSTGKIVVGGYQYNYDAGASYDFALARFNTDGSLDTTFGGGDGSVLTDIGLGGSDHYDVLNGIALLPGDKVVAVGYGQDYDGSTDTYTFFAGVVQYTADGALDPTFSGDGKAEILPSTTSSRDARAVVVTPSGKIAIVLGMGNSDFAVAQLTSTGTLDSTFSGDGIATADFGSSDNARSLVALADGRLVVVGYSYVGSPLQQDFGIAIFNTDGSLDNTFSTDGQETTDFQGQDDEAYGAVVQADGNVVVVGRSYNPYLGYTSDFALARYLIGQGSTSVELDGSGNVLLTDIAGGDTDDQLTLSRDNNGTPGDLTDDFLVIHDPLNALAAGAGVIAIDANTVKIPFASITGNVTLETLAGNDTVTIDFTGGNPLPAGGLTFNGGAGGNDTLSFVGTGLASATLTHTDATSGSLLLDGKTLTYTGLDPILVTTPGANWVLEYTTDAAAVTLAADGANLKVTRAGVAEEVTINPAGLASLTIRTGTGADTIEFDSLPAAWSAAITIDGQGDADILNVNTADLTSTGSITLAGIETANLSRNITANVLSGTATTVNVDDAPSGQIQDGIAVAAVGATVNVAAGSYAESIVANQSVTLLGANSAVSPNTGVRGAESLISGTLNIANGSLGDYVVRGFQFSGSSVPLSTNNNVNVGTTNVTFERNLVQNSGQVALMTGFAGAVLNATIVDNNFSTSTSNAMQLTAGAGGVTTAEVTDNSITTTVFGGISTDALTNSSILRNSISGTAQQAIQIAGAASNVIVSQNTITNANTSNDANRGAIRLRPTSFTGPVIVSNNFISGSFNAISVPTAETIPAGLLSVTNNSLTLPSGGSFLVRNNGTGTLDASGNWFGTSTLAGVTAATSGTVDYTPYLNSGTDTDAGTPGFQGDFSNLTVHTAGTQAGAVGRVQEGVNLVTVGGTVNVLLGTYSDNVVINKSLTLDGAGPTTIIDGSVGGIPSSAITITGSGASAASRLIVKDLTIQGIQTNAIDIGSAVSFVTLENISANGTEGTTTGNYRRGVWIHGTGLVTDLLMDNLTLSGFYNGGIYVDAPTPVNGFTLINSELSNNRIGLHNYADVASTTNENNFTNVLIADNYIFNNAWKGLYFEKLNDAVIERNTIEDTGLGLPAPAVGNSNGNGNSGIELNLKFGDFSNIQILNNIFDNSGVRTGAGPNDVSGALAIKPRDIGSYAANPATLDDVLVQGNIFQNIPAPGRAILIGETGSTPTITPTNMLITENFLTDGTFPGIVNSTVGTVNAEKNWWGSNAAAVVAAGKTGPVDSDPWLALGDDTSGAFGYQPNTAVLSTLAGGTLVSGTGADDDISVTVSGSNYIVTVNSTVYTFDAIDSLVIEGGLGSDTLTVIGPIGKPVTFHGGGGTSDALRITATAQNATYTPDAAVTGNGTIDFGGSTVVFTGLEPIDFDFVGGTFTLLLPNANDSVDIANDTLIDGVTPALKISGSSGGVAFENARVRGAAIVIDTDTVAGVDDIEIVSASNSHLNTSLNITTGTEVGDAITVSGITTFSGTTTLNAPTINLNANVTNTVTGSTATTVNVNDAPSGQIQDGIAVAAVGATVNVAAGTYAENVTLAKQINLLGAQAGVDARGRVVGAPNPAVETIIAPASGVALDLQNGSNAAIINGIAFVGSVSGATGVVGNSSGTNTSLQFINNHVAVATGFTASAIYMNRPAVEATFDKNVFVAASGSSQAVFFDGPDAFYGLHFTNNNVTQAGTLGGTGVFVDGNRNVGTTGGVRAPLVSGNLIQNFALGFNAGQRSFDDAQIVENTFTGNTGGFAGGPLDSTIARNTFSNNSLYGLRLTAFGNTADSTRGAQNTTVSNNVFTNNGTTVDLVNGYGDIRIDDQFNGTQSTNVITNNSLSGPSFIFNRESNAEIINASGNWFGTSTLATISAGILGIAAANVDYTPYLTFGTDTAPAAPGFQGDFSNLTVHTAGAQTGTVPRIQEGVNLVTTGGTVVTEGGSYTGDVDTSSKSVTLVLGSGVATVTSNGDVLLDGNDTLAFTINGNTAGSYDQLIVNGLVTLGVAALDIAGTHTALPADVFTLIDNNLVDPVTGTFAALAGGSLVDVNGFNKQISYIRGTDGNDVVLFTPTIQFSQPTYTINENGTITAAVTLTRDTAEGSSGVQVTFPGTGTATPVDDYASTTIDVTMTTASQVVTMTIVNDLVSEGTETADLALAVVANAQIGSQSTATLNIVDNDIDLTVTKVGSVATVSAPGDVTYTVTVTNNGLTDANGIVLSDVLTLPTGVSVVSVSTLTGSTSPPAAPATTNYVWTVGSLAVGDSATLTVVVHVDSTALFSGDLISNTATVTASTEVRVVTGDDSDTEATSISAIDYGDAPAGYGVAGHQITGLRLGASVDAENSSQFSTGAVGDGADDNGVTLPSNLIRGMSANFVVNTSAIGKKLDAWIDFNLDGDFNDANERVATGLVLASTNNSLAVSVPDGVGEGTTYARFRISTAGISTPDGLALDGEVEDYAITLETPGTPGAEVLPDPENPGQFVLVITGTPVGSGTPGNGNDAIVVRAKNSIATVYIAPTVSIGSFPLSSFGRIVIFGRSGNDSIVIESTTVNPISKPSTIYGEEGNDSISGGSGPDIIIGGDGVDTMAGNAGDDTFVSGLGNDKIVGGAGIDKIVEMTGSAIVSATSIRVGLSADSYSQIERIELKGTTGLESFVFSGVTASVTIDGQGGGDTVSYTGDGNFVLTDALLTRTSGTTTATVNMNGIVSATLTGGSSTNKFTVTDWTKPLNVIGAGGTDTIESAGSTGFVLTPTLLQRPAKPNVTIGTIENAVLTSVTGAVDSTFTIDNWAGTAELKADGGVDTLKVTDNASSMTLSSTTLTRTGRGTIKHSGFEAAELKGGTSANTINASAFSGNLIIDGDAGNDTLTGGSGPTTLIGGIGNDKLTSGLGVSYLFGGAGNDTLTSGKGAAVLVGGDGNDTLKVGTAPAPGATGHAILIGGADVDKLTGGTGQDVLIDSATSIDDDALALAALLANWTAPGLYADRSAQIASDLFGALLPDNKVDTLAGGLTALDLFFANLTGTTSVKDKLTDLNKPTTEISNDNA
ncbi:Bifunctional hemolysin/adenylate cyclase precursor [Anatilimnocola aggregata]|uniref:Bifunctional hemolysin/adenylate cyclase n=1 Tax=Anatilimnocola aggregata TaxID=2528021 RepID=A0A517YED0_9BACT|nr:GEVED domain-containing protein [Anatilimnocola aggregata]QDU28581.1 Bifunctional hemolysin/adenylate cyclase precursor [Anatilimnocola aggregata]